MHAIIMWIINHASVLAITSFNHIPPPLLFFLSSVVLRDEGKQQGLSGSDLKINEHRLVKIRILKMDPVYFPQGKVEGQAFVHS